MPVRTLSRLVILIFIGVFGVSGVSGCADFLIPRNPLYLYTPNPSSTISPTAAIVRLAVLNIISEQLSDGTFKNTAELSISPLGIGSFELANPSKMKFGESKIVRLVIDPNPVLIRPTPYVTLTPLPLATGQSSLMFYAFERTRVSAEMTRNSNSLVKINNEVQIYPVMRAELTGINFEIMSDGFPEKPVISSSSIEWLWTITPKSGGSQSLVLQISIPIIVVTDIRSIKPLASIPFEVVVEGGPALQPSSTITASPTSTSSPTPTLTPTPLPLIVRVGENLVTNSSVLLIAMIGLIGVLITAGVNYAVNKNKVSEAGTEAKGSNDEKGILKDILSEGKGTRTERKKDQHQSRKSERKSNKKRD